MGQRKKSIWTILRNAGLASLALLLAAVGTSPVRAEVVSSTSVFGVYYGTLTVLAPGGTVVSTTNLETATGGGVPTGFPANWFVENDASLVVQFQSDPQSGFANIPTSVFTNLVNLEDATGFGSVSTGVSAPSLGAPYPCCDPGQLAFNAQLAAGAGGPFTTISDTGFQPPAPSLAEEAYNCSFSPVFCTPGVPQPYEFTYLLGPEAQCLEGAAANGTVYCDIVNFQIAERDVTEQQLATPLPAALPLFVTGLGAMGLFGWRRNRKNTAAVTG